MVITVALFALHSLPDLPEWEDVKGATADQGPGWYLVALVSARAVIVSAVVGFGFGLVRMGERLALPLHLAHRARDLLGMGTPHKEAVALLREIKALVKEDEDGKS